jgi:uncharacterized membrane protein
VVSGDWKTAAKGLERVERGTSRVLFWGGLLSIAVALTGLVLAATVPGGFGRELGMADVRHAVPGRPGKGVFTAAGPILRGLRVGPDFDPLAVIALGLGLLLLTPVAGVAIAVAGFLAGGDYLYTAISAAVLAILIASFLTGGGHP